jgi:hypothetical protein
MHWFGNGVGNPADKLTTTYKVQDKTLEMTFSMIVDGDWKEVKISESLIVKGPQSG